MHYRTLIKYWKQKELQNLSLKTAVKKIQEMIENDK